MVPLAGATFGLSDQKACLAPTLMQLRKHPNWMIRIDEMTSFEGAVHGPRWPASIVEWQASGATWHDEFTPSAKTALDAGQIAALEQALLSSCEPDDKPRAHLEDIRWFEIGYAAGGTSATELAPRSPAALALAPIFAAARAQHVSSRLPVARTLVMTVKGKQHVPKANSWFETNGWKNRTITIDTSRPGVSDEDAVFVLDWATGSPETLPWNAHTLAGTLTVHGKTRPVALSIEYNDHNLINIQGHAVLFEIREIAEANAHHDFGM